MKIFFALLVVATFFAVQPARAAWTANSSPIRSDKGLMLEEANSSRGDEDVPMSPLRDILHKAQVYTDMTMSKEIIPGDWGYDYYVLNFKFRGFWNDVQAELVFYTQTLTEEQLKRISIAIDQNYATKGFPQCLLDDMFNTKYAVSYNYHSDPDYTTVYVASKISPPPAGYPAAPNSRRPWTQCVLTEKLYND